MGALNQWWRRDRLEREVDAEFRYHVDREAEKWIAAGVPPDEARARALRSFGPMDKHKADTREARGISWVDELLQDLKYGLRGLAKNPGYAALAILTLGLGIGANTAIFSVINGVLLKPLPYEHGERLVVVRQSAPLSGQNQVGVAIAEYFDYRDQAQVFDGLVEYHQMNFDLLNRGEPDRVSTGVVSHNFFDLLGIKPVVGRTFVATDDLPGAEAVLVLSHTYWRTRFGGDPDIVGQVFEMNDRPHRVIGVLPNVPHYPQENDVYMPVLACPFRAAAERNIPENRRAFGGLSVFGRVKSGHTHEEAAAAIATINQRFTADHAGVYRTATSGFQATALDVRSALTEGARDLLLILLGITSLVLLIACANVANLTLARMLGRDRELALRTALGAGRGRLVRQLLTESTLLASVGGMVGVLFAWGTIGMLTRFASRFTQRTGEVSLDPAVLLFTLGVSVVTGLLFGTLPALGSRVTLTNALKQGSNQAGEAGSRRRVQGVLIVAQVAVSVMLLVGAGLLLASFYRLQQVDPGYRSDGVLSAQVYGNFSRYGTINALRRLYLPILDRLEGQPGVVSAAITNAVPLAGAAPGTTRFDIDGRVTDDPDRRPTTDVRVASERYFETIGIATVSGRVFAATDTAESLPVVVINRAMARYWDEVDPVGT
ncbi:MAG TPA: ADOP family duplicated permease, partial [Vicinamibacterales bacterium]|nr:ADOP family duplicated permease [Vicinamibacterales bacterium]